MVIASPLAAQEAGARLDVPSIPRNQRPMIAVRDFEFQAQLSPEERQQLNQWTALGAIFGRGREGTPLDGQTTIDLLGKQVTTLIQEAIQSTGNFRLFERTQMDAALREQNLGESDRAKQGQGRAEKGEMLVARYVVTGAITKFGKAEKKKGLTSGIISGIVGGAVGGALESRQTEYDIGITIKLIEASTGEVLETFTVDGSALGNKSRRIAGLGGTLGGVIGGAMSNSTTGEKEKLIAQSIRNAVEKAAVQMVAVRERGDLMAN
jgi:curli biogenesis system outer membrane secretion channel CsgG